MSFISLSFLPSNKSIGVIVNHIGADFKKFFAATRNAVALIRWIQRFILNPFQHSLRLTNGPYRTILIQFYGLKIIVAIWPDRRQFIAVGGIYSVPSESIDNRYHLFRGNSQIRIISTPENSVKLPGTFSPSILFFITGRQALGIQENNG